MSEVISKIVKPDQAVLWELYQEATQIYKAAPSDKNRRVWEVTYKKWREAFLNG